MTEIRKADPRARRQAAWLLIAGTLVGVLLILGFGRYSRSLRTWIKADPAAAADRLTLALVGLSIVLSAPAIAFAVYLWALGGRVLRAEEFPPPGYRVIRDTPVVGGQGARVRGYAFRILAACLVVTTLLLWLMLWRLARLLAAGAP
jgi:hypothetical protein